MQYWTVENRQLIFYDLNTIWDNTDSCTDKYICTTELYLLSMLAQSYNIIIDQCVGYLWHGREVVYGLNASEKMFLSMLMTNL